MGVLFFSQFQKEAYCCWTVSPYGDDICPFSYFPAFWFIYFYAFVTNFQLITYSLYFYFINKVNPSFLFSKLQFDSLRFTLLTRVLSVLFLSHNFFFFPLSLSLIARPQHYKNTKIKCLVNVLLIGNFTNTLYAL